MTDRELPPGWVWTTLGELGQSGLFSDGDWVESKDQDPSGGNRLIQLADIGVGAFKDKSSRWMNDEAFSRLRCTELAQDDILIARMPDPLGRACLCPALPYRSATVVDVAILRPNRKIVLPRWLMWAINSDEVSARISEFATGTTRRRISRKNLTKIEIPLPPLPEQHRIVEALEDHLSRLDAAGRSLSTASQRLAPLRVSAVKIALGRPIENQREHTAAERLDRIIGDRSRLVSKRRAKPVAPAYELDLPSGWVTASVDQLSWDIQYGTSAKTGPAKAATDVPVLRMGNLQSGDIDVDNLKFLPENDRSLEGLILDSGDLLFNRTNSAELVGKTAVFRDQLPRATFASYLIRCRPAPGVNADWISHIANSPIGRHYITSVMSQQVGQANVNGTKLAAMPIPLAPAGIEAQILEEISETRSSTARTRTQIGAAGSRSAALRRSLLRAAFNGELVDQDPTDEPAEVALAKLDVDTLAKTKRARKKTFVVQ
ncbi:restriction endonuclease subunit S [Prescottella equi]|uniref:restriction endonuclease subunit S n=1 Tax=Rhodococcus hoagii TaxID=43767 RepID=UPI00384D7A09